eukprot:scaffold130463_cov31-Tisochrysis_lutea.AAC.6
MRRRPMTGVDPRELLMRPRLPIVGDLPPLPAPQRPAPGEATLDQWSATFTRRDVSAEMASGALAKLSTSTNSSNSSWPD